MRYGSQNLYRRILAAICIWCGLTAFAFPAGAIDESELEGCESIAALLSAEMSADAPYICKVAFAATLRHRVESPQFPDSIGGVILEYGSFPSVRDGRYFTATPDQTALAAARDALLGADPTSGALYCFHADEEIALRRPYMEKTFAAGKYVFYR